MYQLVKISAVTKQMGDRWVVTLKTLKYFFLLSKNHVNQSYQLFSNKNTLILEFSFQRPTKLRLETEF